MRQLFEDTINRYLSDRITPELIASSEQGQWPEELWAGIDELGFTTAAVPVEFDGAGVEWRDLFPVIRACGYYNLPVPLPETLLVNWLLGLAGHSGINSPMSIAVSADISVVDGRLSGVLNDVPWGHCVTHVLVANNSEAEKNSSALLLVEIKNAKQIINKRSVAREPVDSLVFENASVAASLTLPATFPHNILLLAGAMIRSAQIAGALQRCLDLAVSYTNDRVQFGKAIKTFQAVQQQMAVLAEQVAAVHIASEAAFTETSALGLSENAIMVAKISASEAIESGVSIAHAVHGAIGFTYEHTLHFSTRRLWAWDNEFGASGYWAKLLGRWVCERGGAQLWPSLVTGEFEVCR